MKKKILVVISIALIACTLVACGNKKDNDNKSDSSNKTQSEGTNKEDDTDLKDKEEEKEDEDTKASELEQSARGETNKENGDNITSPEKPATEEKDKITSPPPQATEGQNNNTTPKPPATGGNNTPPPQATGTTEKDYRIFYYDFPNEKMVYIDKKVKVTDGAVVNALTNELKNNNNNDGLFTLDPGTAVTSAKLDRDNDVLKVYFNESLNNSMNLGTKSQCELVNSIVYTYGYNYGVSKVAIYVNGEPFIDPRGSKPDGYYTVDTSGATEFGK